jgi:hypothetical protein
VNRSADRFSSQADRNSADSGAEILMHASIKNLSFSSAGSLKPYE